MESLMQGFFRFLQVFLVAFLTLNNTKQTFKQDAAHEPECSHVEHFCETSYLNSLVQFSPATVPVHCRLWKAEGCGVQSVGCKEIGVLSGECICIVWSGSGIVECGV